MKKKSFSVILEEVSEAGAARMRRKVPEWSEIPGMEYPSRLSTEQCSSSATAACKAALVRRIRPEGCGLLADLTGGLGVDAAAFSRVCDRVHYNEMDPELCDAVRRNFARLGLRNVTFSSLEIKPSTLPAFLTSLSASSPDGSVSGHSAGISSPTCPSPANTASPAPSLSPAGPDIIFLDPARRSASGRKVFLLEDCSPDILSLRDSLLAAAPDVLAKLSPMADIAMVCRQLGPIVREIHVIGSDGECKELLVWMQRGWTGETSIVVQNLRGTPSPEAFPSSPETLPAPPEPLPASSWTIPVPSGDFHSPSLETIRFTAQEEAASVPRFLPDSPFTDRIKPADTFIFEPCPALMKAGCFNLLCQRLNLYKLGRSTHLYVTDAPAATLTSFGKVFRIDDILPFNNTSIKSLGKTLPRCGVTARNIPVSSDTLAARLGLSSTKGSRPSDANVHVFAFTADFTDSPSQRLIALTHRLQP